MIVNKLFRTTALFILFIVPVANLAAGSAAPISFDAPSLQSEKTNSYFEQLTAHFEKNYRMYATLFIVSPITNKISAHFSEKAILNQMIKLSTKDEELTKFYRSAVQICKQAEISKQTEQVLEEYTTTLEVYLNQNIQQPIRIKNYLFIPQTMRNEIGLAIYMLLLKKNPALLNTYFIPATIGHGLFALLVEKLGTDLPAWKKVITLWIYQTAEQLAGTSADFFFAQKNRILEEEEFQKVFPLLLTALQNIERTAEETE